MVVSRIQIQWCQWHCKSLPNHSFIVSPFHSFFAFAIGPCVSFQQDSSECSPELCLITHCRVLVSWIPWLGFATSEKRQHCLTISQGKRPHTTSLWNYDLNFWNKWVQRATRFYQFFKNLRFDRGGCKTVKFSHFGAQTAQILRFWENSRVQAFELRDFCDLTLFQIWNNEIRPKPVKYI